MNRVTFRARTPWRLKVATALAASLLTALAAQALDNASLRDKWSAQDVATLASMRLKEAGQRPSELSNAYEQRTEAATLGRALFNDTRLSKNGQVACVSCHSVDKQFQDGKQFGHLCHLAKP